MKKQGNVSGAQWPTNRCKRVVRPLLSKIHTLTQTYHKWPQVLDVTFDNKSGTEEMQSKYTANLARLVKPANSRERLESLKPFVSAELYTCFKDVFSIFKNIIVTIETSRCTQTIPKLGRQCSYEIGKAMVLSSRTTYHRLNQNILFDEDTLPADIKRYHKELASDIDEWLDMEPISIFGDLKGDLLMGYILHLIVFNSPRLLYLLVPTLVHWLLEESVVTGNSNYRHFASKLFTEFWLFDHEKYYDNVSHHVVFELTGVAGTSNTEFWALHRVGFWDKFISSTGLITSGSEVSYQTSFLDTLSLNGKLLDCRTLYVTQIYPFLESCYSHPQVNNILINILTRLVLEYKAHYHDRRKVASVYQKLLDMVSVWLSFGFETPGLFSSLASGNKELFQGILKLLSTIVNRLELDKSIHHIVLVLSFFYLNELPRSTVIKLDKFAASMSAALLDLQKTDIREYIPLKYSNDFVNELIRWLMAHHFHRLGRQIFIDIYGEFSKYYDNDLRHLNIMTQKRT